MVSKEHRTPALSLSSLVRFSGPLLLRPFSPGLSLSYKRNWSLSPPLESEVDETEKGIEVLLVMEERSEAEVETVGMGIGNRELSTYICTDTHTRYAIKDD